ncbi:MAG: hypothetical protein JWM43_1181 [Acidobacteriaceae bacterium]|nr:hypothetical protein [Acidobacteriaceae bacterium]
MIRSIPRLALFLTLLVSAAFAQTPPAPSATSDLAPPANPATPDQIREYLNIVSYTQSAHKVMGQMLNASRSTAAPYIPASFWDDMNKSLLEIDLVTPAIPAYQKYFSQQDMAATIAFYKSPAGQRLLAAQPFIASSAGDLLRSAGQQVGQQVFERHRAEIEELRKKAQPASTSPATPTTPHP